MNYLEINKFFNGSYIDIEKEMWDWWESYKNNPTLLTKDQAEWLLEEALDVLCEFDNGVEERHANEAYMMLIRFRDYYFDPEDVK